MNITDNVEELISSSSEEEGSLDYSFQESFSSGSEDSFKEEKDLINPLESSLAKSVPKEFLKIKTGNLMVVVVIVFLFWVLITQSQENLLKFLKKRFKK